MCHRRPSVFSTRRKFVRNTLETKTSGKLAGLLEAEREHGITVSRTCYRLASLLRSFKAARIGYGYLVTITLNQTFKMFCKSRSRLSAHARWCGALEKAHRGRFLAGQECQLVQPIAIETQALQIDSPDCDLRA